MSERSRRRLAGALLRLLGPALLLLLLVRFDAGAAFALVRRVDTATLATATALLFATTAVKALRWRALLAVERIRVSRSRAIVTYLVSIAAGVLTPGRLGELYRAWPVAREAAVPVETVLPSVLVDRLFDQALLGSVALLGLFVLPGGSPGLASGVVALGVVTAAGAVVLFHPRTAAALERRPALRRAGSVVAGIQRLSLAVIARSVLSTLAAYAAFFTQCVLLARVVGIDVAAAQVIAAAALGNLAALLPITLLGVGTREATLIALFAGLGVPAEQALGFSLLLAAVTYGVALLFGLAALPLERRPSSRFRREA